MISFGAVVVEPKITKSFYGKLKPISEKWVPEALKVSGHTREETLGFDDPKAVMEAFRNWLSGMLAKDKKGRIIFVSDNNGFDWQFINWYFHHFLGDNPFGHSSQNLGSLYKGLTKNMHSGFKHLRDTKHTHHPVDDATGNAEALVKMQKMGLMAGIDFYD